VRGVYRLKVRVSGRGEGEKQE